MRVVDLGALTLDGMHELAERLAPFISGGSVVFLRADLGGGKTTLSRAILGALGYSEAVKSPTYSIVETYPINPALQVAHFDLYRLVERDALYHIGFDDFVNDQYALLIEWPEAYVDALPTPTLIVDIALCSEHMRHVVVHASQDALLESLTSWKDV